jgi:hypothetical protein
LEEIFRDSATHHQSNSGQHVELKTPDNAIRRSCLWRHTSKIIGVMHDFHLNPYQKRPAYNNQQQQVLEISL